MDRGLSKPIAELLAAKQSLLGAPGAPGALSRMHGLVTERDWNAVDKSFPGAHCFYLRLSHKPRTFLNLLELQQSFGPSKSPLPRGEGVRGRVDTLSLTLPPSSCALRASADRQGGGDLRKGKKSRRRK